ncbi:MAG: hypothetical protein ABSD71_03585 [Bacteroidales bacterium]|jgi:superfamily II RNA helicase
MDKDNIINGLYEEIETLKKKRAEIDIDITNIEVALQYFKEKRTPVNQFDRLIENTSPILRSEVQAKEKTLNDSLKNTVLLIVLGRIERFTISEAISRMAIELLPKYHKEINSDKKFEAFKTQISSILSYWRRKGKIAKYQFSASIKDSVWGRLDWLNEKNEPKEEYFIHPLIKEAQELELKLNQ